MRLRIQNFALLVTTVTSLVHAQTPIAPPPKSVFHVGYVASGAVYIDGGSTDGLAEGMTLIITRHEPGDAALSATPVATVVITALASKSAVCEIRSKSVAPLKGDEARLLEADEVSRVRREVNQARRRYLQVAEFSNGDPLDEEAREYVPRPPLEEVNRIRGRVAFEQTQIIDHDTGAGSSSQTGAILRIDWSRINGSYWTVTGYWRGAFTRTSPAQSTLTDLVNRTYQIGIFYANPKSPYVMGFGRLLLPWASTLGAIDGGYFARHLAKAATVGVFAGTNPDPTQWNYAPNRQTVGTFVNLERGTYETTRWSGTVGLALTRISWRPERQYIFMENNYSIGHTFSIFENLEADDLDPKLMNGVGGPKLSKSLATIRMIPRKWITFDINHNYFRGVPTFDQRLIGTGLLDQFLFSGFTGGVRLEPPGNLQFAGQWGQSRRNGDTSHSVNQAYTLSWKRLPWVGIKADAHYSVFTSSFGSGSYESGGLSRELRDGLRIEVQGGIQNVVSTWTSQSRAHFLNGILDWPISAHYFMNGGWLRYRGLDQNYDQIYFSLGYRFR
jgi:hypothetical protein